MAEGIENRIPVQEVVCLFEVCLEKKEELFLLHSGEEAITDAEEVGEGGAAGEESMLGGVEERREEGNKEGGEVFTNDPIEGVGDSDGPELVGRGSGGLWGGGQCMKQRRKEGGHGERQQPREERTRNWRG